MIPLFYYGLDFALTQVAYSFGYALERLNGKSREDAHELAMAFTYKLNQERFK